MDAQAYYESLDVYVNIPVTGRDQNEHHRENCKKAGRFAPNVAAGMVLSGVENVYVCCKFCTYHSVISGRFVMSVEELE